MHTHFRTILSLALASLMIANPAFAQSIDLSPVQNLLQGIVDTITGPLGIVIGTPSARLRTMAKRWFCVSRLCRGARGRPM